MKETSQFSLANRKHLADMLKNGYGTLRDKAKDRYHDKVRELTAQIIKEYAEKKKAGPLITQIAATLEHMEQMKLDLHKFGFELDDDGTLALAGGDSNPLNKQIDVRIRQLIGTRDDIDARFDSAELAMMTVATLQDAQQLLKSVTEV